MSWLYHQTSGELLQPDGKRMAYGFAGNGTCMNSSEFDGLRNRGPLPRGKYKMTQWIESDPKLGLCVIVLEFDPPAPLRQGRAGFRIHGARSIDRSGIMAFLQSSDGCICIGSCVERRAIWASPDHDLTVIA